MNLPSPGDTYVLTHPIFTFAGVHYDTGDEFVLVEATQEAPYGVKSGICNWLVTCKHFPDGTIWSNIWHMIDIGSIVKKD